MAGAAIKRARTEIGERSILASAAKAQFEMRKAFTGEIDSAILLAHVERSDPVLLMLPVTDALYAAAVGGDVVAIREVLDRVSGKVAQQVVVDPLGLEDLETALEQISERRRARMLAQQTPLAVTGPEHDVTPATQEDAASG